MSQKSLAQASHNGDEALPVGQPQSSLPQNDLGDTWKRGIGTFVNTLQKHTAPVTAIAISRDGKLIASASYDCTVNLWETSTGSFKTTLQGHTDPVWEWLFHQMESSLLLHHLIKHVCFGK